MNYPFQMNFNKEVVVTPFISLTGIRVNVHNFRSGKIILLIQYASRITWQALCEEKKKKFLFLYFCIYYSNFTEFFHTQYTDMHFQKKTFCNAFTKL